MSDLSLNLTLRKRNIPLQQIIDKKNTSIVFVQFLPFVGSVFEKILHRELCEDATDHPHLSVADDRIFVKIKKSNAIANRAKKVK